VSKKEKKRKRKKEKEKRKKKKKKSNRPTFAFKFRKLVLCTDYGLKPASLLFGSGAANNVCLFPRTEVKPIKLNG